MDPEPPLSPDDLPPLTRFAYDGMQESSGVIPGIFVALMGLELRVIALENAADHLRAVSPASSPQSN